MSGMFGANTPPPNVSTFQPPNLNSAYQGALDQTSNLFQGPFGSAVSQFLPQYQNVAQNLVNQSSPQSFLGMQTAQQFAPQGVGFQQGALDTASNFMGGANSLVPYAMNLAQMGLDPNNAIYNRALQQTTDATGVNLANAGVANSPYGQSVLGNTTAQFNTDWQTQQLQRAISGATGASNVLQGGAGTANTASAFGGQAPGAAVQSGLLPFSTMAQVGGQDLSWLGGVGGATNTFAATPQMGIGDYLGYAGVGNQANSIYNQGQTSYANFLANQQQQQYNNIASAFGGLGSMFGSTGAFGRGGAFGPGGAFPGVGGSIAGFFA